jgi:hypothetical protein
VENIGFVSGTWDAICWTNLPKRAHDTIPSFPVLFPTFKYRSAYWIPSCWKKEAELEAEKKRTYTILTVSLLGKQDRLRRILTTYESNVRSSSHFRQLLKDLVEYETTIPRKMADRSSRLYEQLKGFLSPVRQLHASDSWRWFYPFQRGSLGDKPLAEAKARLGLSTDNWTWLDLIHLGMVTQEAFLEEYCNAKFLMRS